MDSLALVNILYDKIINNEPLALRELCDKIPLKSVSLKASDWMLAHLLDMAAEYDRVECAEQIYEVWQATNLEEEKYSLIAHMLGIFLFSPRSIVIAIKAKGSICFGELFDEVTSRDDSGETVAALSRLFSLVKSPPYNELVMLKEKIKAMELREDIPFPRMRAFIDFQIEKSSPFKEVPKYILAPLEGQTLMTDDELESVTLEFQLEAADLSIDEKIDLMTSGLKELYISVEDMDANKEKLRKELEDMSPEVQEALMSSIIRDLHLFDVTNNEELIKIFGPNHPVYGTELDDSEIADPCQRFGGCRMLLCVCSETLRDSADLGKTLDVISDPEDTEWFRFACDYCHLKIFKPCYAVRRPLDSGGWLGCYCSWKCVRSDTPDSEIAIYTLIDRFEDRIDPIGIYDRSYPRFERIDFIEKARETGEYELEGGKSEEI